MVFCLFANFKRRRILFLFITISFYISTNKLYAQSDCDCAKTKDPQFYKAKVDAGENVQVCSQCAALALYLCICECPTTKADKQQLSINIQTIQATLQKYKDMGNDVCCPDLMKKKANCVANGTQNNTNGSNGSGNSNSNSNSNAPLDPAITELLDKLADAVASGNISAIQNITNQILEIAQQAYPDLIEQIQNSINNTVKNKRPANSKASNNTTSSQTNNYPEGWTYLKQYQKLLNDYVSECNRAVSGGDASQLLNLATELWDWSTKYSDVFTHFTSTQTEALTKMTEYFADAMMKCATGAVQNMQQVHYADEAEQQQLPGNFVPNIQTGTINYTPDTKKPSGQYSGNGDIGNGNGMFENRPPSDPGPPDLKRPPKQ